jgi:SAM-dependent methyltransferase/CDP-glycerol glycerophosphotransferase (TagB/SpsB family)
LRAVGRTIFRGSKNSDAKDDATIMTTISYSSFWSQLRLAFKSRRRAVGFDLASIGEVQFLRSVLEGFAARFPDDMIWMFHHDDTLVDFDKRVPQLRGRIFHVPFRSLCRPRFKGLDLYITTEQFTTGPPEVYTLTLFHGQPAKGVTFGLPGFDPLELNDALFLYGPLQRQVLEEHLAITGRTVPAHMSLFEVGYTKSDDLLNGRYNRDEYIADLGLDPKKKTILYAPAFNEGASMRECGIEILETLCSLKDFNVLAKLAIDCLRPTTDLYATGGVDWFATIGRLEGNHPNFKLVRDLEADPALASSDVLVTCVSSIGFEFLALGRPVIYVDTPNFFSGYLRSLFPNMDTTEWADRTAVNGGREFGLVVSHPCELPQAIAEVLSHPEKYPRRKNELLGYLLFNPGEATMAALDTIANLLGQRVRSSRRGDEVQALLDRSCGHVPLNLRISARARYLLLSKPTSVIKRFLNRYGYTLAKTDLGGFIDAPSTVAAARAKGMSVCDYRESLEDDPRKRGRRGRIIRRLADAGIFQGVSAACEIGAGTGMYLEKVIELARPKSYEVYEINPGWVQFLESEYGSRQGTKLVCHPADGATLRFTPANSIDLVQAHGVFVYVPLMQSLRYLKECARVCRPGGHVVFDCYLDTTFSSLTVAEAWLGSPWHFPVIVPKKLLEEFAAANSFTCVDAFSEIHGAGIVDYFVWRKIG